MTTLEKFIARVEAFLVAETMAPSRFGMRACNDPRFVFELRGGRRPNTDLMDRVDAFMADHRRGRKLPDGSPRAVA